MFGQVSRIILWKQWTNMVDKLAVGNLERIYESKDRPLAKSIFSDKLCCFVIVLIEMKGRFWNEPWLLQ